MIEILIALVIIAILAAIVLPAYTQYAQRNRRADAINALLTLQLAQERYRANATTYATLAQLGGAAASPNGFYTLAVTAATGVSYTMTATPTGAQTGDTCGTFTITESGPVVATAAQRECWNIR